MEGSVRFVSPWALASLASLPIAGLAYLLGRLEADRLVAADQGWEMAFYWSPFVFLAIDTILVLGGLAGLIGLVIGQGAVRRLQSVAAGLAAVACYAVLPWR